MILIRWSAENPAELVDSLVSLKKVGWQDHERVPGGKVEETRERQYGYSLFSRKERWVG